MSNNHSCTQNTNNLHICNGTLRFNWAIYDLRVHISTETKPSFIVKRMCVGSLYSAHIPCRYQLTKYSLGSQSALYSGCMTAILHRRKFSNFLSHSVAMKHTNVFGASCAKDFLGDVTVLHNFLPHFFHS